MTDDEIIEEAKKLSQATIRFLCEEVHKYKYQTIADRDGIILCAMIRVIASKIVHSSDSKKEADVIFNDFLNAMMNSWGEYNSTGKNGLIH